jgi:mannose-6-phosphate isomerase-like protein (cupin superfamily)
MHFKEERPWGYFEILYEGEGYKVKKLVIEPGQRTSLQKHLRRSEHWAVVKGEITVEMIITWEDEETSTLEETTGNIHFFVEQEEPHRISNRTLEDLVIIETQIGDCDENDIIRIEDNYGRIGEGNKIQEKETKMEKMED